MSTPAHWGRDLHEIDPQVMKAFSRGPTHWFQDSTGQCDLLAWYVGTELASVRLHLPSQATADGRGPILVIEWRRGHGLKTGRFDREDLYCRADIYNLNFGAELDHDAVAVARECIAAALLPREIVEAFTVGA